MNAPPQVPPPVPRPRLPGEFVRMRSCLPTGRSARSRRGAAPKKAATAACSPHHSRGSPVAGIAWELVDTIARLLLPQDYLGGIWEIIFVMTFSQPFPTEVKRSF